jgi:hypothetical protein
MPVWDIAHAAAADEVFVVLSRSRFTGQDMRLACTVCVTFYKVPGGHSHMLMCDVIGHHVCRAALLQRRH